MQAKDFHAEITRRYLHYEVNNDMCHNYYYLVHVRIYNADRTRCRKAKFIVWVDADDVCEYMDADSYTEKDIQNLIDEIAFANLDRIKFYDDVKDFYDYCNSSIERFNKIIG